MRFSNISFFCSKGKQPTCEIKSGVFYKIINIESDGGVISIFVHDESDLIAFKNSVSHAYKEYKKKKDELAKMERDNEGGKND